MLLRTHKCSTITAKTCWKKALSSEKKKIIKCSLQLVVKLETLQHGLLLNMYNPISLLYWPYVNFYQTYITTEAGQQIKGKGEIIIHIQLHTHYVGKLSGKTLALHKEGEDKYVKSGVRSMWLATHKHSV